MRAQALLLCAGLLLLFGTGFTLPDFSNEAEVAAFGKRYGLYIIGGIGAFLAVLWVLILGPSQVATSARIVGERNARSRMYGGGFGRHQGGFGGGLF
ncbi:hypothetical protein ACFL2T_02180 [Elusimicrobiota bacterium]